MNVGMMVLVILYKLNFKLNFMYLFFLIIVLYILSIRISFYLYKVFVKYLRNFGESNVEESFLMMPKNICYVPILNLLFGASVILTFIFLGIRSFFISLTR